ncbi:MAG: hypothetical protein DME26_20435 [Verrucomicrobia bacterium]|nr:MAG: hypothetical protein DME26_20435 [Verrucomicrobiota bacterium]
MIARQLKESAEPSLNSPSPFFFRGLQGRLLLLVLLPVVPALALALYTNLEQRHTREAQIKNDTIRLVQLAAANQERLIENARELLAVIAQIPAVRGDDLRQPQVFLAGLPKFYTNYANFGMADLNGKVVSSGLRVTNQISVSNRAWFHLAVQTRDFAVGEYEVSPGTGIWLR